MKGILPKELAPFTDDLRQFFLNLAIAAVILIVGWTLSKLIARSTRKIIHAKSEDIALSNFLGNLAKYLVLVATIISSLGTVGVKTTSLIAVLGAAGFAIGMALQGSLSHFASGIMLLFFRPFNIGDTVEAAGVTGTIKDIGIFFSTIHTFDGHKVIIPNGKIIQSNITNISALGTRRGKIEIGVAYGTKLEEAEKIIREAVEKVETVLEDPAPLIRFGGFGASSLNFNVFVWANTSDYGGMLHQAHYSVYNALNEKGIDIPFDQIVVHQA